MKHVAGGGDKNTRQQSGSEGPPKAGDLERAPLLVTEQFFPAEMKHHRAHLRADWFADVPGMARESCTGAKGVDERSSQAPAACFGLRTEGRPGRSWMTRRAWKERSLAVSLIVVSEWQGRTSGPGLLICCCCLVTQLCPTLFQPMDCRNPWTFFWPRLLCPWDFPGKNTGVVCHLRLQGIFPILGSNPYLLHWRASSLPPSHQGSPVYWFRGGQSWKRKWQPSFLNFSLSLIPTNIEIIQLCVTDKALKRTSPTNNSLLQSRAKGRSDKLSYQLCQPLKKDPSFF